MLLYYIIHFSYMNPMKDKIASLVLWYVKNWIFGPKYFGVAPMVQNFHFITSLVQFVLTFFKMTSLPFSFVF